MSIFKKTPIVDFKVMSSFPTESIEIQHLKGKVEAIKHYYDILIAKNVSKVEAVIAKLDGRADVEDIIDQITDEIESLNSQVKKTRSPLLKAALLAHIQSLRMYLGHIQSTATSYKEIIQLLRQVL